jgi:predicted flap endonuclease-1-like 5' DNA nuclease/chromosome segregation ATPase
MGYLIVNHFPFVALAMVLAGIAGWTLHQARTRPWWDEQDAQRESLRLELIRRAGQTQEEMANFTAVERAALLSDNEAAQERIVGLEQQIASLADDKDRLSNQVERLRQDLRNALVEAERAPSLQAALTVAEAQAAELALALEAARAPRPEDEELAQLREEREGLEAAIAALEQRPQAEELAAARAMVAELDAALRARAEPEDELNRTRWRARYLDARVRYLEARESIILARPASPPVDREADDRRRWRLRYLEARLAWSETSAQALLDERKAQSEAVTAATLHQESLTAERDAALAALAEAHAENARLLADHEAAHAASSDSTMRIAELEGALAAVRGEAAEAVRRHADAEGAGAGALNHIEALEAELASEREAHGARAVEADEAARRAKEAVEALADLRAALDTARARFEAAEAELVGRRARLAELDALLDTEREAAARERRTVGERDEEIEALRARLVEAMDRDAVPRVDEIEHRKLRWRARYLESRVRFLEETATIAPAPTTTPAPQKALPSAPFEERRPPALPAARSGAADDLRQIDGIGPRVESTLNSLGVFHFDQIAAWTPENVAWVERYLAFRDRVGRERWIEQARALARDTAPGRRRSFEGEYV